MPPLGEAFVRVGLNTSGLMPGLARLKSVLTGTFRTITSGLMAGPLGMLMGGGPGAGPLFAGYKMLSSAASFEQAMTDSLVIMKGAAGMYDTLSQKARQTARELGVSHDTVARSYFYLASAGMDAQNALRGMPVVARFGRAGNFDLAQATDILTDAQSALGMKAEETTQNIRNLTRVSDVLTKGNVLANASIQQFGEAIVNKAGASMRLVGKDIEEGVAVLAAFADQGTKGAEAGTALGIVMRDLQTKAIQNKDKFKAANVAVFNQFGMMRNLADIVSDLERRLAGLSDEQKKSALLSLGFSDKSVAYIQALLGTSDAIRGYEKELRKATGETERIAKAMGNTFLGRWLRLKATLVDFAIGVGTPLLRALEPLVEGLSREIPRITASIEAFIEQNKKRWQEWGKLISETWRNVTERIDNAVGGIKKRISNLADWMTGKIGRGLDLASMMTSDLPKAWEYIKISWAYLVNMLGASLRGTFIGGAKAFQEVMLYAITKLGQKLLDVAADWTTAMMYGPEEAKRQADLRRERRIEEAKREPSRVVMRPGGRGPSSPMGPGPLLPEVAEIIPGKIRPGYAPLMKKRALVEQAEAIGKMTATQFEEMAASAIVAPPFKSPADARRAARHMRRDYEEAADAFLDEAIPQPDVAGTFSREFSASMQSFYDGLGATLEAQLREIEAGMRRTRRRRRAEGATPDILTGGIFRGTAAGGGLGTAAAGLLSGPLGRLARGPLSGLMGKGLSGLGQKPLWQIAADATSPKKWEEWGQSSMVAMGRAVLGWIDSPQKQTGEETKKEREFKGGFSGLTELGRGFQEALFKDQKKKLEEEANKASVKTEKNTKTAADALLDLSKKAVTGLIAFSAGNSTGTP